MEHLRFPYAVIPKQVISPIFQVSRALGVLPVSNGFQVSRPLLIYSALKCSIQVAAIVHGVMANYKDTLLDFFEHFRNPNFSRALIIFTSQFRAIALLICLLRVGMSRRDFYLDMFPRISIVELDMSPSFPKSVAAHALVLFISCVVSHYSHPKHLLFLLIDRVEHFSMCCIVAQYGTLIELLTQQFANRIQKLRSGSKTLSVTDSYQIHQNEISDLRRIEAHLAEILTLCTNINDGFGIHMLLTISYFAFHFLMDTFLSFGVFRADRIIDSLSVALPAFLAIVLIFKACHVCELFYTEVRLSPIQTLC